MEFTDLIQTSRHGGMAEEFANRIRRSSRELLRAIALGEQLQEELEQSGETEAAEQVDRVVHALRSDANQGTIGKRTGQQVWKNFAEALGEIAQGKPDRPKEE